MGATVSRAGPPDEILVVQVMPPAPVASARLAVRGLPSGGVDPVAVAVLVAIGGAGGALAIARYRSRDLAA